MCTLDSELGAGGKRATACGNGSGRRAVDAAARSAGHCLQGSQARAAIVASLAEVRRSVPAGSELSALCRSTRPSRCSYSPMMALSQLMLDDGEHARLDQMWAELRYEWHDHYGSRMRSCKLLEYATQDSDPGLFEPYRKQIYAGADAFRQQLLDTQPVQVDRLVEFASRALPPAAPCRPGEGDELARIVLHVAQAKSCRMTRRFAWCWRGFRGAGVSVSG